MFDSVAVVDCDAATPMQLSLPHKGGNQEYAVAAIAGFIRRLGHTAVRLRSDGEPSIVALANAVATKRLKVDEQKVTVEQTPRYSSQSLGAVGAQQRILQGQTRTIRAATEKAIGDKVGPGHILWPWLARHCGFIVEMYHIKTNGRTPHQDALGSKYSGTILRFAEVAMFKHPMTSTMHMSGGRRGRKSKTAWEKGDFVGKTYERDEFMMATPTGVHLIRTVRRLPEQDQTDPELMAKIVGVPWDRKVGQIGRPKGKVIVVPSTPPPAGAEAEAGGQGPQDAGGDSGTPQ